jgi:hypothetical protein
MNSFAKCFLGAFFITYSFWLGSFFDCIHRTYAKTVLIWGDNYAGGKSPLVFVENGIKIYQEICRRDILKAVQPLSQGHFGKRLWIFQQYSASCLQAWSGQSAKTISPCFIRTKGWPPYSINLSPMNYSVWSILKARACATHHSIDELKASRTQKSTVCNFGLLVAMYSLCFYLIAFTILKP